MQQVRCTNCGSAAIVSDASGEFCKCEACGSTFNVPKATEFSKVQLDHTQDIRAWREYLGKQLKLQQESNKARDYSGVKLFARKILSVLPDDFRAAFYVALSERYEDNDTAFTDFMHNASFASVTPEERREVVDSLVSSAEPRYVDDIKLFIKRAYPNTYENYDQVIDLNVKNYIQKLRYVGTAERDVFICHRTAAPDQDIADAICTRLEERGLRCWIAPRNILAGSQNYERDIIKGVENCRIFLVVSSFKSIYSEDCEMELKSAVLADKALYSYRIDDTEYDGVFKKALEKVQWLDASDDPYAHLEQLVIDIKGMLAEDAREKAELEEKRLAARELERRQASAQRTRELERLERLERIVTGGEAVAAASPVAGYRSRLKRAEIEVGSGNYERAENIVDEVLDGDPENPLAWWILLLCNYRVPNDMALSALDTDFTTDANFKNAEKFADTAFAARIEAAVASYRLKAIKAVDDVLDEAEARFGAEEFSELSHVLDRCADSFIDESGIIFKKFPDVASRYFWLRLWAKYGQTPLVCVEDITREKEYRMAVRYASPAQAADYEKIRVMVSKNAQLFLRERSRNRANDSKLVDYLVDNKNILPIDTYNYYSSLLYYRKMLKQLNLTGAQLRETGIDITTNEYFILAQSLATDEQRTQYEALVKLLDYNRDLKSKKEKEDRDRRDEEAKRNEARIKSGDIAKLVIAVITGIAAFALFMSGATDMFAADVAVMGALMLLIAGVCRIVNDAMVMGIRAKRGLIAFPIVNLIISIVSIGIEFSALFAHGAFVVALFGVFVSIASMIVDIVALSKRGRVRSGR